MSNVSQIETPDGSTYDLVAKIGRGLVRATMDNTASSATSFIVSADNITSLYDGLTIVVTNTKAASKSGIKLNLNNLGAKTIWISNSNAALTTQWALNATYILVFDSVNDRWIWQTGYNTNTDTTTISVIFDGVCYTKAGANGIKQKSLVMLDMDGTLQSLTTTSGTGTSKAKNQTGFIMTNIFYINIGSDVAAGTVPTGSCYVYEQYNVDMRYSTNCGSTLVAGKFLYLVGTVGADGLFYLDDTWWTQTLPTTEDGKVYIFVGNVISTTNCHLSVLHPSYIFKNGGVQLYSGDAKTVNGHTVNSNVPSDAAFTDTHRVIKSDGTQILDSGDTPLDIRSGDNVNLTLASGTGSDVMLQINAANTRKSFYGTCTTAAATAAKEVTLANTDGWELVAGVIIGVKFSNSNSASNVTLNVNGSGAKSIYFSSAVYTGSATQITGYANIVNYYMYDGTNWVFINTGDNYRDTNTVTQLRSGGSRPIASANNGIYRYTLFGMTSNGTFASFATSGATSTKTFDTTDYFDISKIYYNNNSSGTNAGGEMANNTVFFAINAVDMRYSANGVTTSASTSSLVTQKPLYLVFDRNNTNLSNNYHKLKSPYYTQTPNDSNAIYVKVGMMNDCYRVDLWQNNEAFVYLGSSLVPYHKANAIDQEFSGTVNGAVGDTTVTISYGRIRTGSSIIPYCQTASGKPVTLSSLTVPSNGSAVLTFPALTEAATFKLLIMNTGG